MACAGTRLPPTFDTRGHGHFLWSSDALTPVLRDSGAKTEVENSTRLDGVGYICLIVADPWWRQGLAGVHSHQQTALERAQRRLCVACAWVTVGSVAINLLLPARILARVVQHAAPVEARVAEGEANRAALYLAAERNDTEALGVQLACGARMNQPGNTDAGDTPLMAAARCGSTDAVALLLECGVDWRQCNNNGTCSEE